MLYKLPKWVCRRWQSRSSKFTPRPGNLRMNGFHHEKKPRYISDLPLILHIPLVIQYEALISWNFSRYLNCVSICWSFILNQAIHKHFLNSRVFDLENSNRTMRLYKVVSHKGIPNLTPPRSIIWASTILLPVWMISLQSESVWKCSWGQEIATLEIQRKLQREF